MADSFFPNRFCGNSSLTLTCPQGEEESIPLLWVESGRSKGQRNEQVVSNFIVAILRSADIRLASVSNYSCVPGMSKSFAL